MKKSITNEECTINLHRHNVTRHQGFIYKNFLFTSIA